MIAFFLGVALVTTGESWCMLLGAVLASVGAVAWWEDSQDGG